MKNIDWNGFGIIFFLLPQIGNIYIIIIISRIQVGKKNRKKENEEEMNEGKKSWKRKLHGFCLVISHYFNEFIEMSFLCGKYIVNAAFGFNWNSLYLKNSIHDSITLRHEKHVSLAERKIYFFIFFVQLFCYTSCNKNKWEEIGKSWWEKKNERHNSGIFFQY